MVIGSHGSMSPFKHEEANTQRDEGNCPRVTCPAEWGQSQCPGLQRTHWLKNKTYTQSSPFFVPHHALLVASSLMPCFCVDSCYASPTDSATTRMRTETPKSLFALSVKLVAGWWLRKLHGVLCKPEILQNKMMTAGTYCVHMIVKHSDTTFLETVRPCQDRMQGVVTVLTPPRKQNHDARRVSCPGYSGQCCRKARILAQGCVTPTQLLIPYDPNKNTQEELGDDTVEC